MRLYAKQTKQGKDRFLLVTRGDPETRGSMGLVVDMGNKTVQRVRDLRKFVRLSPWQPMAPGDPSLDQLVQRVPALRPYRGIEVCLPGGETAWIRWGRWTSESVTTQETLAQTTDGVTIPVYELDGDYFLATQAMAALGGKVLDPPRSFLSLPDDAY